MNGCDCSTTIPELSLLFLVESQSLSELSGEVSLQDVRNRLGRFRASVGQILSTPYIRVCTHPPIAAISDYVYDIEPSDK